MAWVEVHQSLMSHRKTLALADALDIKPVYAVGHLVAFWTWAIDNALRNGDVTGVTPRAIARVVEWDGDSQVFVDALVSAGFLDRDGEGLFIHDWDYYIGKLIDRRESNADRQRRFRERSAISGGGNGSVAHDVTVTSPSRNGATVPNRTQPNRTVPNPQVVDTTCVAQNAPPPAAEAAIPTHEFNSIFSVLAEIPGYEADSDADAALVEFFRQQAIAPETALSAATALAAKWPGNPRRPYADARLALRSWAVREIAPQQPRPGGGRPGPNRRGGAVQPAPPENRDRYLDEYRRRRGTTPWGSVSETTPQEAQGP